MALTVPQLMGLGMPGPLATAIVGGDSLTVTDGATTIPSTTGISFSGATVSSGGAGIADVSISGGSGILLQARLSLSASQIKTLHSSPVQIVAAPGAGKYIQLISASFNYTFNTKQFQPNLIGTSLFFTMGGHNVGDIAQPSVLNQTSNALVYQGGFQTNDIVAESVYDNQPLLLFATTDLNAGAIVTSSLHSGGSGYAPGDTGLIEVSETAEYVVDTVGGGGAVLTYHLDNNGSGYLTGSNVATLVETGAGSNFTVNILSITQGDGSAVVTITYLVNS